MAGASLALSIVALIVSMGGLGWTVFEWHRSGARLKVTVTSFALLDPFAPSPKWMIAIEVVNSGRTATTVSAVGFNRPGGGVIVLSDPAVGPNPIPKRLEPGDSFTYPVSAEDLLRECNTNNVDHKQLTPYAKSGHGNFDGKFLKVGMDVLDQRA